MAPSPLRSTWLCAGALLALGPLLAGAAQLYPAGAVYTFLGCVMALEARLRRMASKVS